MSLHCASTLYVVRHGHAEYGHDFYLCDEPGWLDGTGREQMQAVARTLAPERLTAAYTSPLRRAVESAQAAAELLDLPVAVVDGLREVSVGECLGQQWHGSAYAAVMASWRSGDLDPRVPGGEDGHEALARLRTALETIADQHRGERVLVVTHGAVMAFGLPLLGGRSPAGLPTFLPNAAVARLEVDDDGWHLVQWPGQPDPPERVPPSRRPATL